jgi:phosphoserine aminotransferase
MEIIQKSVELFKKVLKIPNNYHVGIVPASSSGAMETLLWSLSGRREVDVLACCVFSNLWAHDIVDELKIPNTRLIRADFPDLSDISQADFNKDVVFCMSSTTSGAAFRDLNSVPNNREGLVICDVASAAFTMNIDWTKIDAAAFSWQKGLGGEAGFGSIVLGPRAIARLESYKPDRPIPRIFRIAKDNRVNFDLFNGHTINTPSVICLEEFYNNLVWCDNLGGIEALVRKVEQNYRVFEEWISRQNKFRFLTDEKYRAHHVVCLDVASAAYLSLSKKDKWNFLRKIVAVCEKEEVGFDFLGHPLTEPHLRIWSGPTIEASDLEKFLPWLEFACDTVLRQGWDV